MKINVLKFQLTQLQGKLMNARNLFISLITMFVMAGCTKGPSPNLCASVCDGLVAYYPFYGNATDKSGNGHDLSVLGPTLSKDRNGYQNHSYLFDGRTTHLRFAKPLPNLGGGPITVAIWFKVSSFTNPEWIFADQERAFSLSVYQNQVQKYILNFEIRKNMETWDRSYLHHEIELNKPYHFTGVVDEENKRMELYINGEIIKKRYWSERIPFGKNLVIGGNIHDIGKKNFNGLIDEVRIYNRALSADEVQELYLFTSAFPPAE